MGKGTIEIHRNWSSNRTKEGSKMANSLRRGQGECWGPRLMVSEKEA